MAWVSLCRTVQSVHTKLESTELSVRSSDSSSLYTLMVTPSPI